MIKLDGEKLLLKILLMQEYEFKFYHNLYYVNEGARKDSYEPLIGNKDNHIFRLWG